MNTPGLKPFATTLAGLFLVACTATTTPKTDALLGNALRDIQSRQTLDPEASENTSAVAGLDGRAARSTMEAYHDSFRPPSAEGRGTALVSPGNP